MRPSDSPEQDAAAAAEVRRAEFAQFALENLFDISPDAIFVTDAEGIIRGANPRAAELFGHTQTELIGQPIENLVPERFRSRHPSHRENYNAHPRARQMGAAMNLFGLRKDGTEFPVDIMLKPLETPAGTAVLEHRPRCNRAARSPGTCAAQGPATALTARRRARLCHLPSRQRGPHHDMESRRGARQAIHSRRDYW